jgi:hypothetical protein
MSDPVVVRVMREFKLGVLVKYAYALGVRAGRAAADDGSAASKQRAASE